MPKRPHIYYVNMGPWPCFVGITTCAASFARELRRLGLDEALFLGRERAKATLHTLVNKSSLCFILALEPFNAQDESKELYAAVVAHEAVHLVQELRDELSGRAPLGAEAEAYLVQYVVQEALQIAFGSTKKRQVAPQ